MLTESSGIIKSIRSKGKSTYLVAGTIQQTLAICEELGLSTEPIFYPEDLAGAVSRTDDPYNVGPEARVIIISKDDIPRLSGCVSRSSGWVFIVLDSIYNDEARRNVASVLDPKTKFATKLAKLAYGTPIDLRKVMYAGLTDRSPLTQQLYRLFPYTAKKLIQDNVSDIDIENDWSWCEEAGLVSSLYLGLIEEGHQGIYRWEGLGGTPLYPVLNYAYEKAESGIAPVIIKTTHYYIKPFLESCYSRYASCPSYPLRLYGAWVHACTHLVNTQSSPGLTHRVSGAGREYIAFSPSAEGIKYWLELLAQL